VLVARALRAPGLLGRREPAYSEPAKRTWPTEDVAARRSGAFWRLSHCFAKLYQADKGKPGVESTRSSSVMAMPS
jgi:hypothetical protein